MVRVRMHLLSDDVSSASWRSGIWRYYSLIYVRWKEAETLGFTYIYVKRTNLNTT